MSHDIRSPGGEGFDAKEELLTPGKWIRRRELMAPAAFSHRPVLVMSVDPIYVGRWIVINFLFGCQQTYSLFKYLWG